MKKRIGIVCYPSLGGSGIVATELGHELALRGHEVHFITYEMPFRLNIEHKNVFFHQVEINRYDLFRYADYALPLAVTICNVVRHYNLDLIHVHYAIPHATSAYLAGQILGANRPAIITTLHGTDITLVGRDPSYTEMVSFSIEQSDAVTAVSESLKKDTLEHFEIKKPIEVIHNFFIPNQTFRECQELKEALAPNGEKLIIHASNFRSVKRPLDVIDIFARVRAEMPAKLLLLGGGGDIELVRLYVSQKKLTEDVIFFGVTRDVDPHMACGDLFLLPSEQESFGLAALEAMCYGVPVIGSKTGGLPELVTDRETGFLSPVGDVNAMAQNALKLLKNPELHRQFSEQCIQRANRYFSADKIIPQYIALYDTVLQNRIIG
jgi:N-acetyl-alpha-D-glucosaminyl L-malate synthase BshA